MFKIYTCAYRSVNQHSLDDYDNLHLLFDNR